MAAGGAGAGGALGGAARASSAVANWHSNEVLTIFVAGHDTTANALAWTWHTRSQHPDILARVQAEVDTILQGRVPTMDDLSQLPYVQQVFNELLRFSPPLPQVGPRRVLADTTLRGYHIPAGSRLIVSIYNIHHHPDFWPEPTVFDVQRGHHEDTLASSSLG